MSFPAGRIELRDRTIILFCAILFLTLLPGMQHGLWRPDEPQVAGVCAGMAYTQDFVVPRLNGDPFLEKPPLYYAFGAALGLVFGKDNDLSYRLVSILFAGLTLFIVFRIASMREGTMNGLLASGVLASSWGFFRLARWIQVDMSLVFFVTLAMYAYIRLSEKSTRWHSMLMGLSIGLSFMAKGFVGPVIIAAAILTDLILKRDLSIIKKIRPLWALAMMFITALPWILALYEKGGLPFLREVIVVNNLMRFTGAPEGAALGHMHGPLYYLRFFPVKFLPWTFALIPALISSLRKTKGDPYLGWFIGPFLLLSIASAKRDVYLIPLFPACACMTASWLSRAGKVKWEELILNAIWGIALLLAFAPLLGIFFGRPVLGVILGFLSFAGIYKITQWRGRDVVRLVMVMCVTLSIAMTLYYNVKKEKRDYLGFTREAVRQAAGSEIVILMPDEIFEGTLPMITGKTYTVLGIRENIRGNGLYLWADKHNQGIQEMKKIGKVDIVLEKKIGERYARLAFIKPWQ
jgi:4-amino-4-deoxy-L-arabinose transferase-like glycosyltransferase